MDPDSARIPFAARPTRACALLLLLAAAGGCARPDQALERPSAAAPPVIPFNSNFWSYWTHYWATWLPDHPVYEMIELTAWENPKDPSDLLVRVFLTERAGRKRQYFYLNDQAETRRSRANSHYREIEYRRSGGPGRPQDLAVAFTDKDGVPIRWTMTFGPEARLRDHGAGLTPSIHSLGGVLLFALRTRTADTHDDQVTFDGVDYAARWAADDRPPAPAAGTIRIITAPSSSTAKRPSPGAAESSPIRAGAGPSLQRRPVAFAIGANRSARTISSPSRPTGRAGFAATPTSAAATR